jgi:predicted transposase YdaD
VVTKTEPKPNYDSPWKEVLELYFRQFSAFFFPQIYNEIDWSKGYQFLDKELQKVVREAKTGRRLVDKLVKVWRKDSRETWVLVHIEIQGQVGPDFAARMFLYHYRIYDRYARQVVSLAILADERLNWRPDHFGYDLWGCEISFKFPIVKLLDFKEQRDILEQSSNPFAVVTMAYLQAIETRNRPEDRFQIKLKLTRSLYNRGFSRQQILELFCFIDWIMELPQDLEDKFAQKIYEFEEEKKMHYITSIERKGVKQGLQQGLQQGLLEGITLGLELKFGKEGMRELPNIKKIKSLERLRIIFNAIKTVQSLDELRQMYNNQPDKM